MPNGNVFSGHFDFRESRGASISREVNNTNHYGGDPQADKLLTLIVDLRQQIAAHERVLHDAETLRASVDMLQEQMETGRPAPSRLRALLTSMATLAGNVTAVSAAISAVRAAVG
jgi:hypothetical protein